jgi:hypothetical protein
MSTFDLLTVFAPADSQENNEIELRPENLVARGEARIIYVHPGEPNRLVKVVDPRGCDARRAAKKNRPAIVQFGQLASWQRELTEYCRMLNKLGRLPDFVAQYHGFVQTNLGVGLVVERIGSCDTQLAPSLLSVNPSQNNPHFWRNLIGDFFRRLDESGGIAGDLNPRNIVYCDKRLSPCLVLVDGLGDRTVFPFRAYFESARKSWLARAEKRLCAELGLDP